MSRSQRVYWYGIGLRPAVIQELAKRPGWEPVGLAPDPDSIASHLPQVVDLWVLQAPDLTETLRWGRLVRERMGTGQLWILVPNGAPWDVWRAAVNAVIGPAPHVRTATSIGELVDNRAQDAQLPLGAGSGSHPTSPPAPVPQDPKGGEERWSSGPAAALASPPPSLGMGDAGTRATVSPATDLYGPDGTGPSAGFTPGIAYGRHLPPASVGSDHRPPATGRPQRSRDFRSEPVPVAAVEPGDSRIVPRLAPGGERTPSSSRPGSIWTLQGPKGGVGTTWLSCELAAAAAATGLKVGLVDADWTGGDAATYLDLGGGPTILDLQPVMDGDTAQWEQQWLIHPGTGLRLLAAPPRADLARLIESETLARALARGRLHFDLLIVDGPADGLSSVWQGAGVPTDRRLLITVPTPAALRRARAWLDNGAPCGGNPPPVQVVINRWPGSESDQAQIERYLRHPVVGWLPDAGGAVDEALAGGNLLVLQQPGHPLAVAVQHLALRLLGYDPETQPNMGWRRWLPRWLGSRRVPYGLRSVAGA